MGTFFDYAFRFEGDDKALALARKKVEKFQKENAEYSGNGNCDFDMKPKDIPGGFRWGCFATGDIDDFMNEVEDLAWDGHPLRIYTYMESTDGQCWCNLSALEGPDPDGEDAFSCHLELDDAALGLDAALAYWRCERGEATDADLGMLRDRFKIAWGDGWEEYDTAWLLTAGACVRAMSLALARYPADSLAWGPIESLEEDIRSVRSDLVEMAGVDGSGLREIDTLLALLDERKISKAAPTKTGTGKASSGKGTKGKKAAGKGTKASGATTL